MEGACEMLELDPLYVANEGIFIAIVNNHIANDFLAFLRNEPEGLDAAIIGEVTNDYPGKVIMKKCCWRKACSYLPTGEQLPRIC